jgi:1,4-alpha-glucan branching enzyme
MIFRKGILLTICSLIGVVCQAQVSISPANAGPEEPITLTFDASLGNKELVGATKIYAHHGVVTDKPTGTAWSYVKGQWGADDGVGLMTKVSGTSDTWELKISPSVRAYFGVPSTASIFRLSLVFRNADGSKKGTIAPGNYPWGTVASSFDIYVNLKNDNFVTISQPTKSDYTIAQGDVIKIQGDASSTVTDMRIILDEGAGFVEKAQVSSGKNIYFDYKPTKSGTTIIKVTATMNGQAVESSKTISVLIKKPNTIAPLPVGLRQGINYHGDPSKVTLVLLAPNKQVAHVVGDFTNWSIDDDFQMNRTPDDKYFWLEISGLIPNKDYVYQYWVDGSIKIGDPYAEQVADPWNDSYIEQEVFPNLPQYNRTDYGIATVLRTAQTAYAWSTEENAWKRPEINSLVIYELHIRDFIKDHSYDVLRDTLSYLKRLGINAIELMPVSEFEGNDSWGYNPSFFFALDKYYGTKDALKRFIEEAHRQGIAVIIDMVLNHSFGQSPLLKLYYDAASDKPAANNPWYNRDYVGQYQWGYDFNHESQYTKDFVDAVNAYWLKEYHFDGFRFDFTKGFTNKAPNGSVDGFDQSRIDILKRMYDKIKTVDPTAYVILEHWAPSNEEAILGNYGMKMWRNKSYDFVPAAVGANTGTFNGTTGNTHVALYNSHDERRIAEHCLTEGFNSGGYDVKNKAVMLERIKMTAAFFFLQPGPKMMWQFDELGYDIDINFNGRIGRKPYAWGTNSLEYYEDINRQYVYQAYSGILDVRNTIGSQKLAAANTKHKHEGNTRRLSYDTDDIDLVVFGNIDVKDATIDPQFTKKGWWYDYFFGDSINVENITTPQMLKPGEWHIYTSKKINKKNSQAVAIYDNPVTISPYPFLPNQTITITFDASKADPKEAASLKGSPNVYMQSGIRYAETPKTSPWDLSKLFPSNGKMTSIGNDKWTITLTPNLYYGINGDKEIREIGMWFRDSSDSRRGFGFRGEIPHFPVLSDSPIITVEPTAFKADDEITIIFDAAQGNRELVGASKVYMHSGVGTVQTNTPQTSAWTKVQGTWGQDSGKGLMTKLPNSEKWQIKLTPKEYYGLTTEQPYWIAAVFRNVDGSKKGTTSPGILPNGFVSDNLDYFIQNQIIVKAEDDKNVQITLFPNPTSQFTEITGLTNAAKFVLYDDLGKLQYEQRVENGSKVSVASLRSGTYIYHLKREGKRFKTGKIIVLK